MGVSFISDLWTRYSKIGFQWGHFKFTLHYVFVIGFLFCLRRLLSEHSIFGIMNTSSAWLVTMPLRYCRLCFQLCLRAKNIGTSKHALGWNVDTFCVLLVSCCQLGFYTECASWYISLSIVLFSWRYHIQFCFLSVYALFYYYFNFTLKKYFVIQ